MTVKLHGITLFCDDLRREDSGKLLIIGMYAEQIRFLGPPPGRLPTFVAYPIIDIGLEAVLDKPFKLQMQVSWQEGPFAEIEIDLAQLVNDAKINSSPGSESGLYRMNIPLKVEQFLVPKPGVIKMRGYFGDDEIKLGGISVVFAENAPEKTHGIP